MSDVGTVSLDAIGSFVGPASRRFFIAAFSLQVIFYVGFVFTYGYGTWIMYRASPQARRQRSNVILMVANTAMFLLATTHLALDVYAATLGFHAGSAVEAAKFMMYVSQTLIGDGFMIYRLYRVFNRSWVVAVVPSILLLLDAVIGYTSTFLGIIGFYMSVAFYGISLLINVICTVLIMWRVYYLTREFQEVNRRKSKLKIWKVIEATVQSTAIYSAAAVSLVITFVNSTEIGYPTCLNIFPALLGLVFSFIVIRVAHNAAKDDHSRPDSQYRGSSSMGRSTYASNAPILDHREHDRSPMREVFFAQPISPGGLHSGGHSASGGAGEDAYGVLHISHIKTDSERSLAMPELGHEEARAT
ncbi:hypothetical protein C8Q76DRAFT_257311 [Earliella scabrosa]|nr:hypothetical protein C8Q76DRAFT_257311 [Earliella scabrosa]